MNKGLGRQNGRLTGSGWQLIVRSPVKGFKRIVRITKAGKRKWWLKPQFADHGESPCGRLGYQFGVAPINNPSYEPLQELNTHCKDGELKTLLITFTRLSSQGRGRRIDV